MLTAKVADHVRPAFAHVDEQIADTLIELSKLRKLAANVPDGSRAATQLHDTIGFLQSYLLRQKEYRKQLQSIS